MIIGSDPKKMKKEKVYIIAEAGVNHNGDLDIAFKMVDVATEVGVDAIKFQTFKTEDLVCTTAPKAEYQKNTTYTAESQFEMIKKLELDRNAHYRLKDYCDSKNIQFLSSPFDLESIDFLIELDLPLLKVPSGEITNFPYLKKIGESKIPVILSTGMATLDEVEQAVEIFLKSGTKLEQIVLLQCNTEYPTPMNDVNLKAMYTLSEAFPGVKVGYSDHTEGTEIPIAAVAMGARVIEKHFTLDKTMEGPDHLASLDPVELKSMVTAIRNVEMALGNGVKKPSKSELKNIKIARKSLVAARTVKKGEILDSSNITVKRPGTGINPMRWIEFVGTTANRDYQKDELIEL